MKKSVTAQIKKLLAKEHGVKVSSIKIYEGCYVDSNTDRMCYGVDLNHSTIIGFDALVSYDEELVVYGIRRNKAFDMDSD